jgi:hopanoid biosynthesis associated protein HpnK
VIERRVIISADDFGLAPQINQAVEQAHQRGALGAAGLMAGGGALSDALERVRRLPRLDLGLHAALVAAPPCAPPASITSLLGADGQLLGSHAAFVARWLRGKVRPSEVREELDAQLLGLQAQGVRLTHLDSHQHLHVLPGLAPLFADLATRAGVTAIRLPVDVTPGAHIPARRRAERVLLNALSRRAARVFRARGLLVCGSILGFAHAGHLTTARLVSGLASLPAGLSEVVCHPGTSDRELEKRFGWGYQWEAELEALCSPATQGALAEHAIQLTTFGALSAAGPNAR